jgi:hypothetical protein
MTARYGGYVQAVVVGIALALLVPLFGSTNAEGAFTNKTVLGTVYDQTGNPVIGADVTVEIWGGYWPEQDFFRISSSTVTDASGYYEVTFSSNYWDPHNTIKVIANYGSYQKTHIVEANGDQYQTVDVFMNLTIPESSGPLGLLAMMVGCIVPIMFLLARWRK